MTLSAEQKSEIVDEYKRAPNDTGSPEVQAALLTARIKYLTEHWNEWHAWNVLFNNFAMEPAHPNEG